jgi:glycosyltransferase involved in cell wall biosynthesis
MTPGQIALKLGGYPLHLARLRLQRGWRAIPMKRLEDKLVAAMLERLGGPVEADIVTIITTYQRPSLLRLAISSALAQDVPRHHVLVIDDAGGQLPDIEPDPRLTVISLPVNTGTVGIVRNVGIRITSSRLIAFLDDDNSWMPEHLKLSAAAHRDDVGLTYTGIRRMHGDGTVYDELNVPWSRHAMMRRAFVDTSAIVVKRSAGVRFSRIPRRRGANCPGEDWQFVYRISRWRKVVHVPQVTVNYLLDTTSYYTTWRDPLIARNERPG